MLVHPEVSLYQRERELVEDLELQNEYNDIDAKFNCKGPGKCLFLIRQATEQDFKYLAKMMEKLLNSPSFAIQKWAFKALKNDNKHKV